MSKIDIKAMIKDLKNVTYLNLRDNFIKNRNNQ